MAQKTIGKELVSAAPPISAIAVFFRRSTWRKDGAIMTQLLQPESTTNCFYSPLARSFMHSLRAARCWNHLKRQLTYFDGSQTAHRLFRDFGRGRNAIFHVSGLPMFQRAQDPLVASTPVHYLLTWIGGISRNENVYFPIAFSPNDCRGDANLVLRKHF